MNEMILCVIKDGNIVEYSTAKTDMETTQISMDFLSNGITTVSWIRKSDDDNARQQILKEYERQITINKITDILWG